MKRPLRIAVILGLIGSILFALYLNSLKTTYKQASEKIKVIVSKQYIDQGVVIDGNMVEEKLVPKEYVQPKAIQSLKDFKNSEGNRVFMTIVPVENGEQIVTTKLFMIGLDTGLSSLIPAEKRALTIICSKEDVYGIIKPGNKVDIIGVFDYDDKEGHMQEASATVLQNILVLSVGKSFFGNTVSNDGKNKINTSSENYDGRLPVSLAVTPHEAELLTLANEKGVIKFALRGIADDKIVTTQGTKIQDIIKDILTVTTVKSSEKSVDTNAYIRDMQRKQHEALELLKKYQKK